MANTPEEDILGWLQREEESIGIDKVVLAGSDIDIARLTLFQELGYDPTTSQLNAFMDAANTKYNTLPSIDIGYIGRNPFSPATPSYRDLKTGRFVSRKTVQELLRED